MWTAVGGVIGGGDKEFKASPGSTIPWFKTWMKQYFSKVGNFGWLTSEGGGSHEGRRAQATAFFVFSSSAWKAARFPPVCILLISTWENQLKATAYYFTCKSPMSFIET